MKILLVYPGPRHSTFDVALGYHEALEELGHEVAPFNFHDYLEYHDGALEHWKRNNPDFGLSDEEVGDYWMRWSSEPLIIHIVEQAPDIILIVSGLALHVHTYRLMSRFNIPKVIILTESPYIDRRQSDILIHGGIHLAFANDKNSVIPLRGTTDKPVEYLPHSYSPLRHCPGIADEAHQTDVYFHGSWWPERAALLGDLPDSLNGNGYKFRIVGVGWEKDMLHMKNVTINDELVTWYQGTKIALNHHRTITTIGENAEHIPNGAAWSIGPRAYEIAACGAFQLCDDTRPELFDVFRDSVAAYHNAGDLRRKIEYYLTHDDEREAMAQEALALVAPCSFVNRAEQILLPVIMEHFG